MARTTWICPAATSSFTAKIGSSERLPLSTQYEFQASKDLWTLVCAASRSRLRKSSQEISSFRCSNASSIPEATKKLFGANARSTTRRILVIDQSPGFPGGRFRYADRGRNERTKTSG